MFHFVANRHIISIVTYETYAFISVSIIHIYNIVSQKFMYEGYMNGISFIEQKT